MGCYTGENHGKNYITGTKSRVTQTAAPQKMAEFKELTEACLTNDAITVKSFDADSPVWGVINKTCEFKDVPELASYKSKNIVIKRSLFHVVAFLSNRDIFGIFLDRGARLDVRSSHGDLALHYACASSVDAKVKVASLLARHRDDISIRNIQGETPLCLAFHYGPYSVVELLLANSASLDVTSVDGFTLLHYACLSDVDAHDKAKYLLDAQPQSVNKRAADGKTALYFASNCQKLETVRLLLEKGADASIADNADRQPVHGACFNVEAVQIIQALLSVNADFVSATPKNGWTPLSLAAGSGNYKLAEFLITRGARTETATDVQPIHRACAGNSPEVVQLLLDSGVSVNVKDVDGRRPLHYAARSVDENLKVLSVLLGATGIDVCATDSTGSTPLHGAVHNKRYAAALFLLDHGASACAKDNDGKTALQYLSAPDTPEEREHKKHEELYQRLVQLSAANEPSPAATSASTEQLLDTAATGKPEDLVDMFHHGVDVNQVDSEGKTALHQAATRGESSNGSECVNVCLLWGSDVNSQDKRGDTALHQAVRSDNADTVKLLTSHADTDTTIVNYENDTPFTLAQTKQVKLLIESARLESDKIFEDRVSRLIDEQRHLWIELERTRAQATKSDHELKQSQKREQNQAAEIQKLKAAAKSAEKLESTVINLQQQVQNMHRSIKHRAVLVQELKTEIKQLHNQNQGLINQVHGVQVTMTREGRFDATVKQAETEAEFDGKTNSSAVFGKNIY